MSQHDTENELPPLLPKLFFGLSTDVIGNAHFLSDHELLHPAGKILVIDNLINGDQKFIKIAPSSKQVSIISISQNRKFVVVGEKGARPTLSVYDVAGLKRLKYLGVPGKENSATDWASIAFLQDIDQLVAVTKDPDWSLLVYDWRRGKLLFTGPASQRGCPVHQVLPNPDDSSVLVIVGHGLFRLMSQSDNCWRQYGFSRAEHVPLETAAWIGPQQLISGSRDGRLILIDAGELKAVYSARELEGIHLAELRSAEPVTLASQKVAEEDKKGDHEVRALVSFPKGFIYSCNVGEIFVFKKIEQSRWVKSDVIKIKTTLSDEEYKKLFSINFATVNPSNDKIVVTIRKTELHMSALFTKKEDEKEKAIVDFSLVGSGYHDGPIVGLSSCPWKPIFLTAGARDKTIRIWNFITLEVIIIKRFSDEIYSAALHPTGFFSLLGFTDKLRFMAILVDELKTLHEIEIRGCSNVAFARGGHIFAAARGTDLEIYSSVHFSRLLVLQAHLAPVTRLVFGPRDKSLWSCGAEGSLYQWDMDTGQRLTEIFTNKNGQLGLAVSDSVYTVGTDGKLKEIVDGEILREVDMQQSSLTCVCLGNSGQMLVLGGEKGSLVSVVYPLVHPPKWGEFLMHSQPLVDIVISEDESRLITSSDDGFLCIWAVSGASNRGRQVSEVLVAGEELERLTSGLKELGERLLEREAEHLYAIGRLNATNNTKLAETNSNYNNILQDLKFRIKQLEREHLVEINKFQNKLKEEKGNYGDAMDQLEKRYSEKLLAELRRIEELQSLLEISKQDNEKLKTEEEEKRRDSLEKLKLEKNSVIKEKDKKIEELEADLRKAEEEKENTRLLLEEEFSKKKEDVGKSFVTKVLEKESLIGKLKNENGILVKTHILIRKDIEEHKRKLKMLEVQVRLKEEKLKYSLEESESMRRELEEREGVIANKDKTVVKLTKQNDVLKRDLSFRDTTAQAVLEKVKPKDALINMKDDIIEEKVKQIEELTKLKNKGILENEHLKRKMVTNEQEIRRQKVKLATIRTALRRILEEILKDNTLPHQYLTKMFRRLQQVKKNEVQENKAYKVMMDRQNRMERIIRSLQNKLKMQSKQTVIHKSNKIAFELITGFNRMSLELAENKKKIRYLETLLELSLRKE